MENVADLLLVLLNKRGFTRIWECSTISKLLAKVLDVACKIFKINEFWKKKIFEEKKNWRKKIIF